VGKTALVREILGRAPDRGLYFGWDLIDRHRSGYTEYR
jgi:hypothetical protein